MQRNYENNITINNGVYMTLLTAYILIFFYIFRSILFFFFNREDQFKIIHFRLCLLGDVYWFTLRGLVRIPGFLWIPVTKGVTYSHTEPCCSVAFPPGFRCSLLLRTDYLLPLNFLGTKEKFTLQLDLQHAVCLFLIPFDLLCSKGFANESNLLLMLCF